MEKIQKNKALIELLEKNPQATAYLKGSAEYPDINGYMQFYELKNGVFMITEVTGLPKKAAPCGSSVFGFHIHSGTSCSGNKDDPFANALTHYNPKNCPHPQHAGDLPPLFENNGNAFLAFVTSRFTVNEIIGKTVIIHSQPDDFTTQPAGNAGKKIACGLIRIFKK